MKRESVPLSRRGSQENQGHAISWSGDESEGVPGESRAHERISWPGAAGQKAIASSKYQNEACRAFDGGFNSWESEWISAKGDTKGYVGYDFGPGAQIGVAM